MRKKLIILMILILLASILYLGILKKEKVIESDFNAEDEIRLETEDMKTYGYEIVVDSTIPELTNEFTFTEQRVINKITWKCGIIRIYVRDYYFNGNHISTQCFII